MAQLSLEQLAAIARAGKLSPQLLPALGLPQPSPAPMQWAAMVNSDGTIAKAKRGRPAGRSTQRKAPMLPQPVQSPLTARPSGRSCHRLRA